MAQVQENNNPSGIKLFGATIALKLEIEIPLHPKTDHHHHPTPPEKPDPAAEKRPEKIIPCPRCKSMDTKFCYFNNYNVNQPRHFCKGCQRYWTAGGALRNVPIGAGRRKAKPPCPDGSFFDASAAAHLDFEWRQAAEQDGFRHLFPEKRRRCAPNSQSC